MQVNAGGTTTPSNATIIWNFLRGKGLNEGATAGIMGNLKQESSLNPAEHGGGLAQWQGGRWNNLVSYANSHHESPNSMDAQLGYLWTEIQSGKEGVTVSQLNQMNPVQSADYFSSKFERPGIPMIQNREKYANQFYSQFTGQPIQHFSDNGGTPIHETNGDFFQQVNGLTQVQPVNSVGDLLKDGKGLSFRIMFVVIGLILFIFGLAILLKEPTMEALSIAKEVM